MTIFDVVDVVVEGMTEKWFAIFFKEYFFILSFNYINQSTHF